MERFFLSQDRCLKKYKKNYVGTIKLLFIARYGRYGHENRICQNIDSSAKYYVL